MDVASVIRYAGQNYTGAYRDVPLILKTIKPHVPNDVFEDIKRILVIGAPAKLVGESTRDNFDTFRQYGNHPTVNTYRNKIEKLINKEEKNKYIMVFPLWIHRFIANLHLTPQSVVVIPGKNNRLVWDRSFRLTETSTPLNDVTCLSNEPPIFYGTCFTRHLNRIWELCLAQPSEEILLFDDDVKSCFRHAKLNLEIATAFSFILQ